MVRLRKRRLADKGIVRRSRGCGRAVSLCSRCSNAESRWEGPDLIRSRRSYSRRTSRSQPTGKDSRRPSSTLLPNRPFSTEFDWRRIPKANARSRAFHNLPELPPRIPARESSCPSVASIKRTGQKTQLYVEQPLNEFYQPLAAGGWVDGDRQVAKA